MESFEITLFYPDDSNAASSIPLIDGLIREVKLFRDKKVVIEIFSEEHISFSEIRVSIFDLVIKEDNFTDAIKEMIAFVTAIFRAIPCIEIATGVYELTYYFTENVFHLNEFDPLLRNFPVLFLKPEREYVRGKVISENDYVKCIFQEDAQKLY